MRYQILEINASVLVNICTENFEYKMKCVRGLPKGTKFVRMHETGNAGVVAFIIEHPVFPELTEGQPIPLYAHPEFEKL